MEDLAVDVVIYSKNRAAQLDLLLRSIRRNFANVGRVFVLNDFDGDVHYNSYVKVWEKDYGLNIVFRTQTRKTFYDVLLKAAADSTTEHILPMCDDDVFIRRTDVTDAVQHIDANTVGLCFRRSTDLTYSYHTGQLIPNANLEDLGGGVLRWKWRDGPVKRWGYPYQAGSLVYSTAFFRHMLANIKFDLPNWLECEMMQGRFKWGREYVLCLEHSPVVNVSINRVQSDVANRGGRDVTYSPEELAQKFLEGQVIDLCPLQDMINTCEFIEIPLAFRKGDVP
jgi:hypothetical protein